jgi:hypothetical protein
VIETNDLYFITALPQFRKTPPTHGTTHEYSFEKGK